MSLRLIDRDNKLLKSMNDYLDFDLSKDKVLNKNQNLLMLILKKKTLNQEI